MCFQRAPQARVHSAEASSRTLRERTSTISDVRKVVSGGSVDSITVQFADELQRTNREERETVLREAGILGSGDVPTEECLAMKASLAIPWNKLRHIRRYNTKAWCTIP